MLFGQVGHEDKRSQAVCGSQARQACQSEQGVMAWLSVPRMEWTKESAECRASS